MPHNNQPSALNDNLTGQYDVTASVATYNLTNPAGQRVNVFTTAAPVAFTTDGTVPAVGGAGTQLTPGPAGGGVATVTLPVNAVLKVVGQRAGLVLVSRAP